MHKMSNLEYFFVVKELGSLAGKHFNRIRKLGEGIYRMKIGSDEVICGLGVRIHRTKYIEASEENDKFAEKANKELENARLLDIKQINNDRIVSFDFDSGLSLVFEMFGEGNAILVKEGKIVCAAKYESWSDRQIKPAEEYKPPKTAPSERLEVSDKYIIVSLMKLPLGKEYALEALSRAGIDEKAPGNSLSGNKIMDLERVIEKLKAEARPSSFSEGGKIEDFSLTRLAKYGNLETKEYATLGEAADEYYHHYEKPNPKLEKLSERLEKQKERLAELEKEEKETRAIGDFIYEHYQKAEEILSLGKTGKFDDLGSMGAKIDKKEKSVEIELQ